MAVMSNSKPVEPPAAEIQTENCNYAQTNTTGLPALGKPLTRCVGESISVHRAQIRPTPTRRLCALSPGKALLCRSRTQPAQPPHTPPERPSPRFMGQIQCVHDHRQ